jgi:hypothetical protein
MVRHSRRHRRLPSGTSLAGVSLGGDRLIVRGHGIFSLGALIALAWKPGLVLLPWALSSALLTAAAMWDYWSRGGNIDYLVLGLAAYELMIGLLEEESSVRAGAGVSERDRATRSQSVKAIPTVESWRL